MSASSSDHTTKCHKRPRFTQSATAGGKRASSVAEGLIASGSPTPSCKVSIRCIGPDTSPNDRYGSKADITTAEPASIGGTSAIRPERHPLSLR